mgnify:CR=1 FL=1
MARPRKSRLVYSMPSCEGFVPVGYEAGSGTETVVMTIDEYETIRLIDLGKLTQEICAERMGISRPTVTNIYESARSKLADALINEKVLLIGGGDYDVYHENKKIGMMEKERRQMKIAVTYENGQIYQHFGHCENFKVYTVEDGKVVDAKVENAAGSGHGALAGFLKAMNVEVLICGGIGGGAQMALAEAGIQLYGGVMGEADAAVAALLEGNLAYNANVQCNHHGHGHGHEEGHACGSHGCGSHSCGH